MRTTQRPPLYVWNREPFIISEVYIHISEAQIVHKRMYVNTFRTKQGVRNIVDGCLSGASVERGSTVHLKLLLQQRGRVKTEGLFCRERWRELLKLGTLSVRGLIFSCGGILSSKCALMFIHQYVVAYFPYSHCALNTREEMYAVWLQILKHLSYFHVVQCSVFPC